MMHEREKSDPAVVAVKLANKAERSAAESVEPRAGTEGNAGQHSTCRAQYRVSVSPALERIRHVRRQTPEVGAVCGKSARTDLCGGYGEIRIPTATTFFRCEAPCRHHLEIECKIIPSTPAQKPRTPPQL